MLKQFEVNDVALATKLEKKHAEKAEIVSKVGECQERLAQKKVEIARLEQRREWRPAHPLALFSHYLTSPLQVRPIRRRDA